MKRVGVVKRVKVPYFLISDTITSLLFLSGKQCRKRPIISHTSQDIGTYDHTPAKCLMYVHTVDIHKDLSGLNDTNRERDT